MKRVSALVLATMLLGGCSGGGGSTAAPPVPTPAPTPTPTPSAGQPPAFTSATAVNVVENSNGTFYQATATDPEGTAVSFAIAGGADAARFALTTAGALSFAAPPSFAQPADADRNNVYEVTLKAADAGGATATLALRVTVTSATGTFSVRRIATGFRQPVYAAPIPGDAAALFVAEKGGNLYRLGPATGTKTLLLTVPNLRTSGEAGLLSVVALPDFATSRQILVTAAAAADGALQLIQYTLPASGPASAGTLILSIPHADHDQHYGGWLSIGPDGYLYMTTGDGGTRTNAPDTNILLGKVLRFAHSGATTSTIWSGAPGNPYLSGGGSPYVFAIGFRNPWRGSWDNGRMLIGDVGEGSVEEVDELRPDQPGLNFGWPTREGTQGGTNASGLTNPVTQYTHGNGAQQGASIIGGYVYRGPVGGLSGQYVFGDFVSKNLWTVPASSLVAGQLLDSSNYTVRNSDFRPDVGAINSLASFGVDGNNNLYLIDLGGDIFKIVAN